MSILTSPTGEYKDLMLVLLLMRVIFSFGTYWYLYVFISVWFIVFFFHSVMIPRSLYYYFLYQMRLIKCSKKKKKKRIVNWIIIFLGIQRPCIRTRKSFLGIPLAVGQFYKFLLLVFYSYIFVCTLLSKKAQHVDCRADVHLYI